MRRESGFIRRLDRGLPLAILFVATATSGSGQVAQKQKKFLTAPLVIEDQGRRVMLAP